MTSALTSVLLVVLTACAESQTGVVSGARSKYSSIAVVPKVNDRLLSVYWPSPMAQPAVSEANMGWSAANGVVQISREILGPTGASVSVSSEAGSANAKAAQVVVILQQTPLDAFAQNYDPGRDLLISAASVAGAAAAGGMAVIIVDNSRRYQPRSVLRIAGSEQGGQGNSSLCAVGLTPSLVNPQTGETIRQGRSLMGIEKLPVSLSGTNWGSLAPAERSTVIAYCQSALRRVVSQSFVELQIVD
ncbi:MAG: hypothetical protein ABJH85_19415 [Paracoccaceae bacterium]